MTVQPCQPDLKQKIKNNVYIYIYIACPSLVFASKSPKGTSFFLTSKAANLGGLPLTPTRHTARYSTKCKTLNSVSSKVLPTLQRLSEVFFSALFLRSHRISLFRSFKAQLRNFPPVLLSVRLAQLLLSHSAKASRASISSSNSITSTTQFAFSLQPEKKG